MRLRIPAFRKVVAALLMVVLASWTPVASTMAQSSCNGCNVVDEGRLNASLVGSTVYFRRDGDKIPVTVIGVDPANNRLGWRRSDGLTGWGDARDYYTPARSAERDTNITAGAAAGAAAILCLFFCDSGSRKSSSSDEQERYRKKQDCIQSCRRNTNYNDDRSVALGQDCINRCERAY